MYKTIDAAVRYTRTNKKWAWILQSKACSRRQSGVSIVAGTWIKTEISLFAYRFHYISFMIEIKVNTDEVVQQNSETEILIRVRVWHYWMPFGILSQKNGKNSTIDLF